jgi:hypothetical protein
MSSISNLAPEDVLARIERILETIPLPENHAVVRTWLQERQAMGLKASTLVIPRELPARLLLPPGREALGGCEPRGRHR